MRGTYYKRGERMAAARDQSKPQQSVFVAAARSTLESVATIARVKHLLIRTWHCSNLSKAEMLATTR